MEALQRADPLFGPDTTEAFLTVFADISAADRRMHATAYSYWLTVRGTRAVPLIQDFDPLELRDLRARSVLLELADGGLDAELRFLGQELSNTCLPDGQVERLSEVPQTAMLSCISEKLPQFSTIKDPVVFKTQFAADGGATVCCVTLLPFSSTGLDIDYVYGLITLMDAAALESISLELTPAMRLDPDSSSEPRPGFSWDSAGPIEGSGRFLEAVPVCATDDNPVTEETVEVENLHEQLQQARAKADAAEQVSARSRAALYEALGEAYDFALGAEADPETYLKIVKDADLTIQARAPMTPIVKLVFGLNYDKARVTEFSAVLAWAYRENLPAGTLSERLAIEGGVKAIVGAERQARRPDAARKGLETGRAALRNAVPIASVELEISGEDEFVLLVARREPAGVFSVLGAVTDEQLFDRAVKKTWPTRPERSCVSSHS